MKLLYRLMSSRTDKALARAAVIQKHYLHCWPSSSYVFGAFVEGDSRIKGVLTIGKPCSPTLWTVCGKVRSSDVHELNRLWMTDDLPKNSESTFIGWCLREIRKQYPAMILVSYADTEQRHIGYVYQATNWVYTGTSAPFVDVEPSSGQRIKRSGKHRYIWFADKKDKSLMSWSELPYPKRV